MRVKLEQDEKNENDGRKGKAYKVGRGSCVPAIECSSCNTSSIHQLPAFHLNQEGAGKEGRDEWQNGILGWMDG